MHFKTHRIGETDIAELLADGVVIHQEQDGIDLIGNVHYQGFDRVIVHGTQLAPAFFDLKTKMAGEILQKFSNYRVRLVIVGEFDKITSQSLRDFISESNTGKQVNFLPTVEAALEALSR